MTLITFKNGLPLFLQPAPGSDIGLVAADSGCCCPPPPPERCWCGDLCSYFIELVEPSELAVKTPTIDCNIGLASDFKIISPSLLQSIVPVTDATHNFSQSGVQSGGGLLLGNVIDFIQGLPDFPHVFADTGFQAVNNAELRVSCSYDSETGLPKFSAQISIGAEARFFGLSTGFLSQNIYSRGYVATLEVPATCVVSPEKECVPSEQEILRIDTPLEITINGDGSSTLGSLGAAIEGIPLVGYSQAVKDAVDAILAATSYTFRITARENCLPPENVCCCLENTVTVSTAEECEGTTSPIADPVVELEDITIVVDWDGLTATLTHPFFSKFVSEAVEFSCLKANEEEAFNATERNYQANFFSQSSGDCRWFSSNISAFFIGKFPSNNFDALAGSSQLTPYVGECKLLAPVDEDDTSCTFTQSGSWCMDNPFSDTITVEMIIAP